MSDGSSTPTSDHPNMPAAVSRWKPLRIWPPILLLLGMVVLRNLPQMIEDPPVHIWMSAAFGPALCGILILLWWLAASRATWRERLVGFFGVILVAAIALSLLDKSMIGPGILVLFIPLGIVGFALGTLFCSQILTFKRTWIALLMASIGFGFTTLLRSDGMWGNFALGLHWRWVPSSEDALVRSESSRRTADVAKEEFADALAHPQWAAFRGPNRDGRQSGPKIGCDWSTNAPKLVWKGPIGPGWSSFAVAGNLLFTQEQRGAMEAVTCYAADSGLEVWTRPIKSRFDDPLGGPGPRATPTLADGGLFAMLATGLLLRLDPTTGQEIWQQDIGKVADRQPPIWGFSSSPLVVDSLVIVHAGGKGDKGTLAFSVDTGELKWSAAAGDHSYSSPQLATILDEQVVLVMTNAGLNVLDPATGTQRLNYEWKFDGQRALQPQLVDSDSVLIPTGMGIGTRRIRISKRDDQWKADELWTTRNLKPEFNDLVVYQGHAYGFDAAIFTCIDLETGNRKWKGGRYGKGQVLLLNDSGLLLVISEEGAVNLLKADPTALVELAKFQAIEGKTWNHPVLVGDRLYVRNAQEAACYRLPLADASAGEDSKSTN